jgi:transcriptional regulator with XRE-family HTH domain
MVGIEELGIDVAARRKARRLSQTKLARLAGISRATLEALENGRCREIGYTKIARLLSVLGLELRIEDTGLHRPTLEDLREEERRDQSLDRRR